MKRHTLKLLIVLTLVVVFMAGCAEEQFPTQIFPSVRYGLYSRVGSGSEWFDFYQGWFRGLPTWYLRCASNNIRVQDWNAAKDLAPKLTSALFGGANPVFIVLNYSQGPVFTTIPNEAEYSALWQVIYVTWKPGVPKRAIIDHLDLPSMDEVDYEVTSIVQDLPIIAVGKLGGPWTPAPQGTYRMPQVLNFTLAPRKQVELPTWAAFGRDWKRRFIQQAKLAITDVSDPQLAQLLLCNFAPGLLNVPQEDTQRLWIFDWTQVPAPPPGQLPVLEQLPNYDDRLNDNFEFSPIMQLVLLQRVTLPPNSAINNPEFIQKLIDNGALAVVNEDHRMNVKVVSYKRWTNF